MQTEELKAFTHMPQSYWLASTMDTAYPPLDTPLSVDIAIVGGGMVGLATAFQLQKSGMQVALLEGGKIVQGTTGHTTAKITSQHNLIYAKLIKQFGKDLAQQYASANETAVKEIKQMVETQNIACDFSPQAAFVFTQEEKYVKPIQDEVEAANSLGINATYVDNIPLSLPIKAGMRFDNQGQFHPRKFLLALAQKLQAGGVQIYEQSRVVDLEENGNYVLTTANGLKVTANKVVIATHFPIYNKLGAFYTRIYQSRTYALVLKVKEPFPGGMFINAEKPNRSLRGLTTEAGEFVLVVGDSHKTGQGEDMNTHYQALIDFARGLFTIEDIPYRWSTQDCMSMDGVPYVGRYTPETPNLYLATGFNKWGITNSLVASLILNDLIVKGTSPWEGVYNPSRKNTVPASKEFGKQNLNVTTNLVGGQMKKTYKDTEVKIGEAKVIEHNGGKAGAFRDENGTLHLVNLTCTHMGCKVNWNAAERSWDCPCHGSRYDIDGKVISSPAVNPLSFDHQVNPMHKLATEEF